MVAKVLKLLCVFFSVVTVLCCGCGRHGAKAAPVTDFTASFQGEYRGLELEGELSGSRRGLCSVTFSRPPSLCDARFSYRDSSLTFGCKGFSASADEACLPPDSLPALLRGVFRAVAAGDYRQGSGKNELLLRVGGIDCVLTCDSAGYPKTLLAPDLGCTLTFCHAAPLGE